MLKCLAAVSVYISNATGSANPLVNQSPWLVVRLIYTWYKVQKSETSIVKTNLSFNLIILSQQSKKLNILSIYFYM